MFMNLNRVIRNLWQSEPRLSQK